MDQRTIPNGRRERESLAEAEILLRLSQELSAELDLKNLVQLVTDVAREVTGAEFGAFFYNKTDDQGEGYTLYTISGVPSEKFASFPMPRNSLIFGPVFRGETTVRINDVKKDPRYGKNPPYYGMPKGHLPVSSYLAAPVKNRKGVVLGGLFFGHSEPGKFTEAHERLLVGVAQQAAIAMANAEFYEQAKNAELVNARMAAIVQSSDDAIISKDLTGIIQTWNEAAERVFGYTMAEAIGRSITMLVPPDRAGEEMEILAKLGRGQRVDGFETVRLRKDGTPIDVWVTVSPLMNSDGKVIGAANVSRDITERKRAEREREHLLSSERFARREAERTNRMKDEFLATLSHELRTPLNAILGWSHLLGSGKLDPGEFTEAVSTIERNARVQMQLIEDLLDMSRIISGKLRLEVRRVDLVKVIAAATESIRPAAAAKNIALTQNITTQGATINGDPSRLQQIVWNLLSNAVKFTPAGGKIEIQLRRADQYVELIISDTGQGISPEFLPNLFGRFQQADSSTTRHHGGLGLGLAIVKNLVELHGGTVRALSNGLNQGTTFTISIPISSPGAEPDDLSTGPAETDSHTELMSRLKTMHVMVVDDEPDARELVKRILNGFDAQVTTAGSGAEALDTLEKIRPDVLVSDIGMPDMDGYEFLRRLRKRPSDQGGSIPAVALTAFARSEDRMRALMSGYQMHVSKPVEPSELLAVVASLATRK